MSPLLPSSSPVRSCAAAHLSRAVFGRDFFKPQKPLLIQGGAQSLPAYERWNPAYLREKCGPRLVRLAEGQSAQFNPNQGYKQEVVIFSKVLDRVFDSSAAETWYYSMQQSIPKLLPEIAPDCPPLPWIPFTMKLWRTNLWIGTRTVSPLHYDNGHNFLCQITGSKKLILFSADETPHLYPAIGSRLPYISQIDLRNPNWEIFPLLQQARPYEVRLEPGDCLFIPKNWWHFVEATGPSISVNYWWDTYWNVWKLDYQSWVKRRRRKKRT